MHFVFPLILYIKSNAARTSTNHIIKVQQENPPSFVPRNGIDKTDFEDRYLNHFNITSENFNGTDRKLREYYHCSITLTNCYFVNSSAFGTGLAVSSGGAILVVSSQLIYKSTNFRENIASTGGAVYGVDCVVAIIKSDFRHNTAFRNAGAVFASAVLPVEVDGIKVNRYALADTQCYVTDSNFTENAAAELGGALYLQFFGTTYLANCKIFENSAGHSGAGAFISKTEPIFYNCSFVGNIAGNRTTTIPGSIFGATITADRVNHRGGLARGGAAISFNVFEFGPKETSHDPFPTDHPTPSWDLTGGQRRYEMVTMDCCFNNNVAFNTGTDGNSSGVIIITGNVQYNSMNDHFNISKDEIVIVNSEQGIVQGWYNFFGFDNNASHCEGGRVLSPTDYETIWEYYGTTSTKLKTTYVYSASVPIPTEFVYQQTPVTRLPYATTRSHKYTRLYANKSFSLPSDIISIVSPINTPSTSPKPTPTPSMSPKPTPSRSGGKFSRKTNVLTESAIFVPSDYWISHYSLTMTRSGASKYPTIIFGSFSPWQSAGTVISFTKAYTEYIEYSEGNFVIEGDGDVAENLIPIIVGVVCGFLLLVVAAVLLWFFVIRNRNDDKTDTDAAAEIIEETITHVPDAGTALITNDNPLWNSSVIGQDDPFKNDFEEDEMEGFTRIKNGMID